MYLDFDDKRFKRGSATQRMSRLGWHNGSVQSSIWPDPSRVPVSCASLLPHLRFDHTTWTTSLAMLSSGLIANRWAEPAPTPEQARPVKWGGKYRVLYEFLGPHFDDPFDTKSPGFRRTVHALDEDWLVRRRPAVRAARRSALLVCTMRDDSVAGGKSNVAMVASGLAA